MILRSLVTSVLLATIGNAGETPLHGSAGFLPTPASPSNFRGDPRGGYPGATIPSAFSAEKNLAWKAEPGQGCGTVVVVGKRLYVQAAPNALVCLDAATGKELWRRTHHAETLDPKSQDAVFDGLMDSLGEYHRLARKMLKLPAPERSEIQAAMDKVIATMPVPWNVGGKGEPSIAYQIPGAGIHGNGNGGIYLICTTPVSDGQRVVARFPTGIVVAYDLDGKHLWSTATRLDLKRPDWYKGRGSQWPPKPSQSACPLITPEGIVVVSMTHLVFGLDVATGKERWRVLDANIHGTYASPVLGRIGNESFVAIGDGTIVRARDGFLVHTDVKGTDAPTCPVFADGVFYWVTHAVRVVPGDPPKAEVIWDWPLERIKEVSGGFPYGNPRLSSNLDMPSPVLLDGKLIYYGASWGGKMAVIDAKTGTILSQAPYQRPKFALPGGLGHGVTKNWPYSGMTRMGDRLVVARDFGLVNVYPINETFAPAVACGVPDDIYAHPVAHGSRLYLRSVNALWCFEEKKQP
ncbi:MAG: PQQ-binding-like beta-propeller repeat protein [bacterium]